ncbi:MAG: phosphate ABC transporter substrate-binding protein PstS [Acidimicrobiia bacterium]
MRGSLVRRCGILLAALALPVLLIGTASAASSSGKLSSATLNGSGSSFQYGFIQVIQGGFKQAQKSVTVNYQPTGSGAGRTDFLNKVTDFGGTDAPYKATEPQPPAPFMYFPTVVAPITVSYNVSGVSKLNLSADTIAKIFQTQITTWNDAAIKEENPKAKLPSTTITVVHRSDSSGTTANFTNFLTKAAPSVWTLGTGSTVSWPASTQGGAQNTGVATLVKSTDGAIGYVDFSDATASDLTFASVKNSTGKYIAPSIESASAAANGASINADLTYDPINSDGATAYPITSPTWIMVYTTQSDANKGAAIKGFLNYIYGDGQQLASSVDYAPLPKGLLKQAKAQVKEIVVPAT